MESFTTHSIKATLSSKGQVVIPQPLREAMGLHAGSEIIFEMKDDGHCQMIPAKRSIRTLFGRGKRKGQKPLSVRQMDDLIAEEVWQSNRPTRPSRK